MDEGVAKSGGVKVGSNLPISQLGVVKCLARGRQGDRSGLPGIIVKQGIPVQLDIHTFATFQNYSANITNAILEGCLIICLMLPEKSASWKV